MTKFERRKHTFRDNPKKKQAKSGDGLWFWGTHAVSAAIENPQRNIKRLCATRNAMERLPDLTAKMLIAEDVSPKDIASLLPDGAVHQGVAAQLEPLAETELDEVFRLDRVVVFDQLNDPHNIGAIFRSAAAFGFGAAILQTRNVPEINGVIAKTAAGAVEHVREIRVVNIARTLETLNEAGFLTIGLEGDSPVDLAKAVQGEEKIAIVVGAEGSGLRPAVAKACAQLAHIAISDVTESLNASNAAVIAFYESARR